MGKILSANLCLLETSLYPVSRSVVRLAQKVRSVVRMVLQ